MILGCSSLTTELWSGSLWYYEDPSVAPSVDKCLTGVDVDAGVSEVAFLDQQEGKRVSK